MSPLKSQPQNAPAAIAGCAKNEDFYNRTSSLTTQAIIYPTRWHVRNDVLDMQKEIDRWRKLHQRIADELHLARCLPLHGHEHRELIV